MSWKPDICIHHFPCDDGFAAAWVVKGKWPDVDLRGTNYGRPVPDQEIAGKNILIVDFSYPEQQLRQMGVSAKSIVVLDHHKTAQADLAAINTLPSLSLRDVPDDGPDGTSLFAWFDMERSGASLAWEFCNPGLLMPAFIHYIEDRDLWRLQMRGTRAFSLLLRSYPYDLAQWSAIAKTMETPSGIAEVVDAGSAIERFYDRKIAELIPTAVRLQTIGGFIVPVLNVPYSFASDAAHELLQSHPSAPFAAAYFDNADGRTYSLRSANDREDVSAIAKKYGGGGHRNAAGFRMPL